MAAKYSIKDLLTMPGTSARMPRLGYGVYLSPSHITTKSVTTALNLGYRHIDTAQYYANEAEVGKAIKESGIPRKDIFVVTKILSPVGGSVEKTLDSLRGSVNKIDAGEGDRKGYVDVFLIHTPSSGKEGRKIMWQALEKLKEEGGAKDIGVSNFGVEHLKQLESYSSVVPVCQQIELHPFCQQREVVEYCKSKGIVVTAYSPIVRNQRSNDKTIVKIAKAHDKQPTQVMIKWGLQKGYVPLPKSDDPERMKSNMDMDGWELTAEEMDEIEKLDEGERGAICPYNLNCP